MRSTHAIQMIIINRNLLPIAMLSAWAVTADIKSSSLRLLIGVSVCTVNAFAKHSSLCTGAITQETLLKLQGRTSCRKIMMMMRDSPWQDQTPLLRLSSSKNSLMSSPHLLTRLLSHRLQIGLHLAEEAQRTDLHRHLISAEGRPLCNCRAQ